MGARGCSLGARGCSLGARGCRPRQGKERGTCPTSMPTRRSPAAPPCAPMCLLSGSVCALVCRAWFVVRGWVGVGVG